MYIYITKNKWRYFAYTLLLIVTSVAAVLIAFLMSELLNVAVEGDMDRLWRTLLFAVLFVTGTVICEYLYNRVGNRIRRDARTALKGDLFEAVLHKRTLSFEEKNSAAYMNMLQKNVDLFEALYFQTVLRIPYDILGLIAAVAACIYLEPVMLVIIVAFALISALIIAKMSARLEKSTGAFAEATATYTTELKDDLQGFRLIQSFFLHGVIGQKHRQHNLAVESAKETNENERAAFQRMMEYAGLISTFVTMAAAAYFAIRGVFPIGVVLAFGHLSAKIAQPIEEASQTIVSLRSSKPMADGFREIIDAADAPMASKPVTIHECITLSHLSFSIGEKRIIDDLSCVFQCGKKYLVTGESGCGKSTLLNLIGGLYDGYEGSLSYDGVEQKEADRQSLSEALCYVPQEIFLFHDTLRNNLTMFQQHFSDEEIFRTAGRCGLEELITSLSDGLDTMISENGGNFSGGEKQRMNLARALLRSPSVLLLDEITSNLDAQTAGEIEEMILALDGVTVISVAHHMPGQYASRYDETLQLKPAVT